MIVCRQCGFHNDDKAEFCANAGCGAYLPFQQPPSSSPPQGTVTPGSVPPPPPSTASRRVLQAVVSGDPRPSVAPGSQVAATVQVRNLGTIVEELVAEARAAPWISVVPDRLALLPGTEATVQVWARPPADSSVPAGPVDVGVSFRSRLDGAEVAAATCGFTVGALRLVAADMVPRTAQTSRSSKFEVSVANQGNVPTRVALSASDPDAALRFEANPPSIDLAAGQTGRSVLVVGPRQRQWGGQATRLPFSVALQPSDTPPIRIDGTLVRRPILPRWLVPLVVVLLAAGGGLVALVAQGDDDDDQAGANSTTAATDATGSTVAGGDTTLPATVAPTERPDLLFARVAADGSLAGAYPSVVSASRTGTGAYEVDFGFDVSACARVGAVASVTRDASPAPGQIAVELLSSSKVAVGVYEPDASAQIWQRRDESFHLVVDCVSPWIAINENGQRVGGSDDSDNWAPADGCDPGFAGFCTLVLPSGQASSCALTATVQGAGAPAMLSARIDIGDQIAVEMRDLPNRATPRPFHLVLSCDDDRIWAFLEDQGEGPKLFAGDAGDPSLPDSGDPTNPRLDRVLFDRDLSSCALVATNRYPEIALVTALPVEPEDGRPGVVVNRSAPGGGLTSLWFNLRVDCPPE